MQRLSTQSTQSDTQSTQRSTHRDRPLAVVATRHPCLCLAYKGFALWRGRTVNVNAGRCAAPQRRHDTARSGVAILVIHPIALDAGRNVAVSFRLGRPFFHAEQTFSEPSTIDRILFIILIVATQAEQSLRSRRLPGQNRLARMRRAMRGTESYLWPYTAVRRAACSKCAPARRCWRWR